MGVYDRDMVRALTRGLARPLILSAAVAGIAPIEMPAGAQSIVGSHRVAGWEGNYCTVKRLSDNVSIDIGWVGAIPDWQAIIDHAGASTCICTKLYDMSGNGNDYTTLNDASSPYYTQTHRWKGVDLGFTAFDAAIDRFEIPAAVTANRQSVTVYDVSATQATTGTTTTWGLHTSWTDGLAFLPNKADAISLTGSGFTDTGVTSNNMPEVKVVSSGASGRYVHVNDNVSALLGAVSNTSMAGGYWGRANVSGYTFYGDYFFHAVYGAEHDLSTINAVKAQLYTRYEINTGLLKKSLLQGDSITWGQGGNGVPVHRYLYESLSERLEFKNIGQPGQLVSNMATATTQITDFYDATYNLCVYDLLAGSNDLAAGATAATVYGHIDTLITAANNAGCETVVNTVLPRGDLTSGEEAERVSLNNMILTNSIGASKVSDLATVMNDPDDTDIFTGDKIHPTVLGHQTQAAIRKPKYEELIAAA